MPAFSITSAVAVPFVLSSTTVGFSISGTPYTSASVASGTYRVCLAPTSGSVKDILRVLATALAAASGLPSPTTFTVTLEDDGRVKIECNRLWKPTNLHSQLLGRILGFDTAPAGEAFAHTGDRAPWFLWTMASAYGGAWQPRKSGAQERTAGGVVFGFTGSVTHYERTFTTDFMPWDPTAAAESDAPHTPAYPAEAYMGELGETSTARVWSVLDVLQAAENCACAFTEWGWSTIRASTSERYKIGYVETLSPEFQRKDEAWRRFLTAQFLFVLPSGTSSGTRA